MKMKLKFYKPVLMFLCSAALLFAFTACGDEGEIGAYEMGTEAKLTGLRIATARLNSSQMPASIHPDDWADEDFEIVGADTRTIYFQRDEDLVEVRIIPSTSKGASVKWGISDRITRPNPNAFLDVRVPASFKSGDYIYLWVKSEDQLTDSYYRFDAFVLKSGVNLADVFVDGKRYNVADGHPIWNMIPTQGDIPLTRTQARGTRIRTVAFEETSTFRFARTSNPRTQPNFSRRSTVRVQEGYVEDEDGNPTSVPKMVDYFAMGENFNDQDILYVEVTAENGVDKAIYKFLVSVGRIATIAKLSLDNTEKSISNEVMAKGTPGTWVLSVPGKFAVAHYDQPATGFKVNITLDDSESKVQYAVIPAANAGQNTATFVNWSASNPGSARLENKNALAIFVTSQNGRVENYYKVEVELLATKFLKQPVSTKYYYYYKRTTPKPAKSGDDYESPGEEFYSDDGSNGGPDNVLPLTFVVEDPSKIVSYQWYESNSWYGGYGFDVDGRVTFSGSANTADEDGTEAGFLDDQYHTKEYDEKSNITLFNGGNNNVRYVIPGRKISSADITVAKNMPENFNLDMGNTPTYKPKITFRPFLPGYSNETHYYWVELTDNQGYKLISERAVIVSERDNSKKHLIFDVNNYYDPAHPTVKIAFKNGPDPFKKKFEKYRIPLFFDGGFDINDYSIFTAQAKFYLTDGKDWIQNWTQGNISFEKDGGIQVLYYNLTNDNAAKSLVSGGNESGSGVSAKPDFVVIEPSGDPTKGNNKDGYPLNPDGSFKEPENLQGWFCGFIELVEFRFEGPRREED
jgi:hypothetical protein